MAYDREQLRHRRISQPEGARETPPAHVRSATFRRGMFREGAGGDMPEWIGSILFLSALGLSGSKISGDFGNRGFRAWAMLMLVLGVYAYAGGGPRSPDTS